MSAASPFLPWFLAAAIVVLNLPFGFWRGGVRRFSLAWFLAVHLPVLLSIALRVGSGAGWRVATLPLYVAAFVAGQFLGGRLRRLRGPAGSDARDLPGVKKYTFRDGG